MVGGPLKALCLLVIAFACSEVHGRCRVPVVPMEDVENAVRASFAMYGDNDVSRIHHTSYRVHRRFRKHGEVKAIVAKSSSGPKIIAFRGTDSKHELKEFNSEFGRHLHDIGGVNLRLDGEHVKVLRRFWEHLEHIYPYIKQELHGELILTGHNFGGALAALVAAQMAIEKKWDNEDHALITFGQPRVGDGRFARLHDRLISPDRKLRFVYHHDRIPHVPYSPEYEHFSREIYMEKHKKIFGKDKMYMRVCYAHSHPKGCSNHNSYNHDYNDNLKYVKEIMFRPSIRRFQDSFGHVYHSWDRAWERTCK